MIELNKIISSRKYSFKCIKNMWIDIDGKATFNEDYGFKNESSYRKIFMPQTIKKLKSMGCDIKTYKYVETHQTTYGTTIDWKNSNLSIEAMANKHSKCYIEIKKEESKNEK